ncbi:MAG: hypothetical protein LBQ54_09620 [Planctomycetaceae bacterium]|jgi:hypothetical protein|nr:hypothetical protein [Planctomycetaceae bacterium]
MDMVLIFCYDFRPVDNTKPQTGVLVCFTKGTVGRFTIAAVFFDFGKKQRRETGSIEPIQPKTGPKPKLAEH